MATSVKRSKVMDISEDHNTQLTEPLNDDSMDNDNDSFTKKREESSEDATDDDVKDNENDKSAMSSADESETKSEVDDETDGKESGKRNDKGKDKKASKRKAPVSDTEKDIPTGNGDFQVALDANAAEQVKSDGMRRERKQVDRFAIAPEKHEEKSRNLVIVAGSGTKLGDIAYIAEHINKKRSADLVNLHRLFYNRRGTANEIKKNLRTFSGFPYDDRAPEYTKKRSQLTKWEMRVLRETCELLGVLKKGTKEQIIERLLEFCLQPTESGVKIKSKTKKSIRRSSTSTSKKTPGSSSKSSKTKSKSEPSKDKKGKGKKRELDSDHSGSEGGHSEKDASVDSEKEEDVKEPPSKRSRDGPTRKASVGKKYQEPAYEEEEEERSESEGEAPAESEDEKKKKQKSKPKKKASSSKSKSSKSKSKSHGKKKASKKHDSEDENSASVNNATDSSDDDLPLIKKAKKSNQPSDDDLKQTVKKIIEKADLKKVSMRMVLDQVYEDYPGIDLESKKSFIKSIVQELL